MKAFLAVVFLIFSVGCGDSVEEVRRQAQDGDSAAQVALGQMYREGNGVSQDYREALVWFRRAAAQGDAEAQYHIGKMYRGGEGVQRDFKMAVGWYEKAALQGHPMAQVNLGRMLFWGQGVRQNTEHAYAWASLAAEQGARGAGAVRALIVEGMPPEEIARAEGVLVRLRERISLANDP